MKKTFLLILICLLLSSCFLFPNEEEISPPEIPDVAPLITANIEEGTIEFTLGIKAKTQEDLQKWADLISDKEEDSSCQIISLKENNETLSPSQNKYSISSSNTDLQLEYLYTALTKDHKWKIKLTFTEDVKVRNRQAEFIDKDFKKEITTK